MKIVAYLILSGCLTVVARFSSHAVVRYVTVSGAGLQNGSSWGNAYPGTSLQTAIAVSSAGDEVWVACGTYFTTSGLNRASSFSLKEGVALYGSFTGTETQVEQRVFTCGPCSVLSAAIGAPGIADNSYHVLSNSGLTMATVVDGFVITGANDDRLPTATQGLGGGIYNEGSGPGNECSPTIRNCVITQNRAVFGGGIFNNGFNGGRSNPHIINCIIAANTATDGGGGIDNFGLSGMASPQITNCLVYANTALTAGGMYCWGGNPGGNSSPVIVNSVFVANTATAGNAGGVIADNSNSAGGFNDGTSNVVVRNSVFWYNSAAGAGPQFAIKGTGSFTSTYSAVDLVNQSAPHSMTGPGTGNISSPPLFFNRLNAAGPDNCWLTADDGLQLQPGSPGIDAGENSGLPATDIRNYPRIMNGVADMGAYEFAAAALPVTWLGFSGRTMERKNELNWIAITGAEHRIFEVQRSDDGFLFYKIGENSGILPAGAVHQYRYTDESIHHSRYYYRIKQTDHNGQFSLSSIVALHNKSAAEMMQVFPNPANEKVTIILPDGLRPGELILMSSGGREVQRIRAVSSVITLPFSALEPGLYFIYCTQLREGVRVIKK